MSVLSKLGEWMDLGGYQSTTSAQGFMKKPQMAMAAGSACGSSCGAGDSTKKMSACGSSCGAGDSTKK